MRLAVVSSHPVQYYAPLFRDLARRIDLHVFFAHQPTPAQQAQAGFGTPFEWDIDLQSGYQHTFLRNRARVSNASRFNGTDTPEIATRLREGRFDAVLTLGWHLKSLLQGIWAAKRLGLPVLVRGDSQLTTPRSRLKRIAKEAVYPMLLRTFDAALYVGARNRAYYENYRYPSDRLFYSPHCVDTERFARGATPEARNALRARLGLTPADRVVLFAGKLLPFKRPLDVVEAAASARAKGLTLHVVVAGSGPLDEGMRARAAELDVPLHIIGFQNQSEMPAAYAAADALVLPSTGRETWGLVCNEALACGVPIVVSDEVGCAPDLAADGYVGRRFGTGKVDECAAALIALMSAPPSAERIRALSDRHSIRAAAEGIVEAATSVVRPAARERAQLNA